MLLVFFLAFWFLLLICQIWSWRELAVVLKATRQPFMVGGQVEDGGGELGEGASSSATTDISSTTTTIGTTTTGTTPTGTTANDSSNSTITSSGEDVEASLKRLLPVVSYTFTNG
jgi:hypothetical protein